MARMEALGTAGHDDASPHVRGYRTWAIPGRSVRVILAMVALCCPAVVSAERLEDALRRAFLHSPQLGAARSDVVARSEDVPEARASGRPRMSVVTAHTEFLKQSAPSSLLPDRALRSDLTVNMPLYRSGIVKYAIKDAQQRFAAAKEDLRDTTASIFADVVAAYNNVLRDEAIVRLGERNVTALDANLKATRGRFRVGDLTVTDVALSEARLLLAEGDLRGARARLVGSREDYVRLVGAPPEDLADPGVLPGLPRTVEEAIDVAMRGNGSLRAARYRIDATEYRIRSAQGERGLRISAFGAGGYFNNLRSIGSKSFFAPFNRGTAVQAGVTLELPLYQGGLPASHIRRARGERGVAIEQSIATERNVIAQIHAAFANWRLSLQYIDKATLAIAANERALKGARMENSIGTRTLLDVLDTERELLNSQVTLAAVRRDANVAAFALLALMGRADPDDLDLVQNAPQSRIGPLRPRENWSDLADGQPYYSPTGSPTVTTPPQTGELPR